MTLLSLKCQNPNDKNDDKVERIIDYPFVIAAQRARSILPEPLVDAIRVEAMFALGKSPDRLVLLIF